MTATSTIPTVDFEQFYTVKGWGGIAFWLKGWATDTREVEDWSCGDAQHFHDDDCEVQWDIESYDRDDAVMGVMVGDDMPHWIDVDDLIPLAREDFCGECGQVGCTHDGYDRG